MAQIIYTAKPEEGAPVGSLFSGKKLFLTQKTPSRSHFIELIKANGGEVVKLEKSADIIIADDARKEVVPGSYSYKWIDQSIKNGALEDLDDYLAGPRVGAARVVGSVARPAKNTRTPYTAEDDRMLFEWVQAQAQRGGSTLGNEMFKQLEERNSRHSWQSWRDRWVKTLRFRTPLPSTHQEAPLAPRDVNSAKSPVVSRSETKKPATSRTEPKKPADAYSDKAVSPEKTANPDPFPKKSVTPDSEPKEPTDVITDEDIRILKVLTPSILKIHPERVEEAWNEWAQCHPEHSAHRWRTFWQTNVLPFARHSSPEVIVEEDELSSREPTPDTSPSLHTQSSHVVQKTPSTVRQIKVEIASTLSSPLKRKRGSEGSDTSNIPSSPPIAPHEPTLAAHSFNKRRALHLQEVSSTPEFRAPITASPSPQQSCPYVKDTLDQVDDYQSVEIGDLPQSGREVSLALSEPQNRQRDLADTYEIGSISNGGDEKLSEDRLTNENPQLRTSEAQILVPEELLPLDGNDNGENLDKGSASQILYPALPSLNGKTPEDTQAILGGEVQDIDLDVPEPEEGWQAFQSSPPPMPSSPKRSNRKGKERVIEDNRCSESDLSHANLEGVEVLNLWIKKQIARGYPMDDIRLAMTATTMDFNLAASVLRFLREAGGIPADAPGVWTPDDDANLTARDARKIRALQDKHGSEGLDRRHEFLSTCRAVQNELEVRERRFER